MPSLFFSVEAYSLPFKKKWITSSSIGQLRDGCIITAKDANGFVGRADAAPLPEFGSESISDCFIFLQTFIKENPTLSITQPDRYRSHSSTIEPLLLALEKYRDAYPVACGGIESAAISLLAATQNTQLRYWLNPDATGSVKTNIVAGSLATPIFTNFISGDVIKFKVGVDSIEKELLLLEKIIKQLPANSKIRLDANQAWDFNDAKHFVTQCSEMTRNVAITIDSIEEPLLRPDLQLLGELQQLVEFPIALDESVTKFRFQQLLSTNWLRRVVLKPTIVGGALTTFNLAREFQRCSIEVIITSAMETEIGVEIATHCAAAVDPQQKFSHGLTTWVVK